MKRRFFLKNVGLFALGGITSANYTNKNLSSEIKESLPRIDFLISHHCNLNCASCDHFAPIAPKYFLPIEIFQKDIKQIKKITKGQVKTIGLLGGEPLLNKDIEKYINIARNYFKKSKIILETNGILLNQMNDSFWKTCAKNKAIVQFTYYPLYKKFFDPKLSFKKAEMHNVTLIPSGSRYCFNLACLNKNKNQNLEKTYINCDCKSYCSILNNGILYPCQIIGGVNLFFNKYFKNYAIPVAKDDYIDIFKIKSLDEILEFYKKPKEFCRYCGFKFNSFQKNIWKLSNKDASEWCDI